MELFPFGDILSQVINTVRDLSLFIRFIYNISRVDSCDVCRKKEVILLHGTLGNYKRDFRSKQNVKSARNKNVVNAPFTFRA